MSRRKSAPPRSLPSSAEAARRPPVVIEREQQTALTHFRAEFFEGPLPPPEVLAEYDKIFPGAASRILAMAEEQGRHRQALEKQVVLSNCRSQDRGPVLGFILATMVIAIGGYLLFTGKEVAGLVALVAALAAVVVPFVTGKRAQQEELAEKRKELTESDDDEPWEYSAPPERPRDRSKEIGAGPAKNRPRPT